MGLVENVNPGDLALKFLALERCFSMSNGLALWESTESELPGVPAGKMILKRITII